MTASTDHVRHIAKSATVVVFAPNESFSLAGGVELTVILVSGTLGHVDGGKGARLRIFGNRQKGGRLNVDTVEHFETGTG